jgi:hypothetical protein
VRKGKMKMRRTRHGPKEKPRKKGGGPERKWATGWTNKKKKEEEEKWEREGKSQNSPSGLFTHCTGPKPKFCSPN